MKSSNYIRFAKAASQYEMNLLFNKASDYWLLAFRYAKSSENKEWCNARFLMCEYLEMLYKKNKLPSCYTFRHKKEYIDNIISDYKSFF